MAVPVETTELDFLLHKDFSVLDPLGMGFLQRIRFFMTCWLGRHAPLVMRSAVLERFLSENAPDRLESPMAGRLAASFGLAEGIIRRMGRRFRLMGRPGFGGAEARSAVGLRNGTAWPRSGQAVVPSVHRGSMIVVSK